MNDFDETPVVFGPAQSLVGVVTVPTGTDNLPIACLMFNADATHRVGPRRIHVKLARELAGRGVSSIRFDLSGLGDSGPAGAPEHAVTQAVLDLQAAMDVVEDVLGIRRFVVICLGPAAALGLALAQADVRATGLLLFDGPAFPGRRSRWERAARRWLAVVARPALAGKTPRPLDDRAPPVSAGAFRRAMAALAERGVAVLMIYSGSFHAVDRGRDQLGPFAYEPFMCDVGYRFEPGIDHGLISLAAQRIFTAAASDWVLQVHQALSLAPPPGQSAGTDAAAPAAP